ncbi:MAG TPA: asparagine synthase (glutamine-hydrolyzing) [Anaerolineaceae bacterium]|nr:asparagine synthase (glutamine-hydrolyzing) [Anaerolineaceae bacterium]
MCGIVGIYDFQADSRRIDPLMLDRMRDTMAHRGPDGAASWIAADGRVGLGFRRLAIIDLSPATMQPMCNEDGTVWLVFNGEIYNHAEIRRELERMGGHSWKTDHADTEVILHAFEEWGIACLEKLRGMFAMAIWDGRKRELWLVRDRAGIKPLYYSIQPDRIVFASEIKAILADPGQKRCVNEEALFNYLSFLATPAPYTLFEGIQKLPAGCWLHVCEGGQVSEQRYWDVLEHTNPLVNLSDDQIAELLLDELRTSVKLRKLSDVPVGVFLSGGIDSSTNAVLFSQGEPEGIKTFLIGYDGQHKSYPNEFKYARLVAEQVKSEHHGKVMGLNDLLEFLPEMVHLQDEPIAEPVCAPIYYIARLARQHGVIVAQVGEGSDELFCGYANWPGLIHSQQILNLPGARPLARAALAGLQAIGQGNRHRRDYLDRHIAGQPIFFGMAEAFSHPQKISVLSRRLRQKFQSASLWETAGIAALYGRFMDKAWEKSPLNWMSYLELNMRLPEQLLLRIDKMLMGASLEGRLPFMDHKLVELALSMPQAVKIRNGSSKSILKKAMAGLLPEPILKRPKQGFSVPIADWFFNGLGSLARQELSDFCGQTDYFDFKQVSALFEQHESQQLWTMLNFALWWKEYIQ